MELVYLWVEEYKNIHKQGFNFSPRFRCEFKSGILSINENIDYMSIFPDNINVTIIVGENGAGKSSLLNFILEQKEYFGLFIFKVKDELLIFDKNIMYIDFNIECNYKYVLNPDLMKMVKYRNGTSLLFLKSYMDINTYSLSQQMLSRYFFHFSKKIDFISELHENTVELFNIISINSKKNIDTSFKTDPYSRLALNQHFTYLKDKYLHRILKYYPDLENFISKYFKIDKVEYKIKDLGSIFLASPSFKDNYKDDEFLSNMFDIFKNEKSSENRLKILCLIFGYLEEEQIKDFILKKQVNLSYIELYELIKDEKYSYIITWNNFIEVMSIEDDYKTIIKQYLIFLKEIRREILEFSFTPSLSSGEEKLLYLFVNIYDYVLSMKTVGTTKFTIIIDEPDTLLHPNWQKKILSLVVTFINTFFKDDIFNIIITTHSPFILSDLPKQNIIFLEKDDKTGDCINATNDVDINPFGANIHTLLSHGFFMKDGLMGEFAKNKINDVINFLNGNISFVKTNDEAQNLINIIGEPIIKKQLQKMLDSKRLSKIDEIDLIKNQMIELSKRLEEIENAKD